MTVVDDMQLQLPVGVDLLATPAMRLGDAEPAVFQCADCGLLVCKTNLSQRGLSACPACGCSSWWKQTLPVGPLKKPETRTQTIRRCGRVAERLAGTGTSEASRAPLA